MFHDNHFLLLFAERRIYAYSWDIAFDFQLIGATFYVWYVVNSIRFVSTFPSPLFSSSSLCLRFTLFPFFVSLLPFLVYLPVVIRSSTPNTRYPACNLWIDYLRVCVFGCMHASHVLRHVYLSLSFLRRCAFVYVCVCGYDYADINGGIMMTTAGLVLATKLFDGINGWSSCGCGRCVVPRAVLT